MGREVLRQIPSNMFRYALYGMRENRVEEGNTTDRHLVHVFESEELGRGSSLPWPAV